MIEIVVLTKSGGPLTKRISLDPDGTLNADGSACLMSRGRARRAHISSVDALAALLEQLTSNQAIALGAMRADLPDEVVVIPKDKLNGAAGVIARTRKDILYKKGHPALALLDHDAKQMPLETYPFYATQHMSSAARQALASIAWIPARKFPALAAFTSLSSRRTAPTLRGFSRLCTTDVGWQEWAGWQWEAPDNC